jgi:hypothetical protein
LSCSQPFIGRIVLKDFRDVEALIAVSPEAAALTISLVAQLACVPMGLKLLVGATRYAPQQILIGSIALLDGEFAYRSLPS